jgi:hypothetical protein
VEKIVKSAIPAKFPEFLILLQISPIVVRLPLEQVLLSHCL